MKNYKTLMKKIKTVAKMNDLAPMLTLEYFIK